MELTPLHIKLMRRGNRGRWIGLSDDMAFRMSEIVALGELERAGLVEQTKEELPPGPPAITPHILTEYGRKVLATLSEEGHGRRTQGAE